MRNRIVDLYDSTPPHVRRQGERWYPEAQRIAADLSGQAKRGAGALAALSPRTGWAENVRRAGLLIAAHDAGEAAPPVLHTAGQLQKAWAIAAGADPLRVLSGPKELAFFRNIMGDEQAVTVDSWAAGIAEGKASRSAPKDRRYALISRAYRQAAERLQVTPSVCQATVWVAARGRAGRQDL